MFQHSTFAAVFDDHGLQAIGLLIVSATLLLGSAWMIAGLLRCASSAVRYCVWQFALMGLLVLPALFAVLPGIPLGLARTGTESTLESGGARLTTQAAPDAVARLDLPLGVRSFAADGPADPRHSSFAMKRSVAAEERDPQGPSIEGPGGGPSDVREPTVAS
jgi:hypothetical protein